MDKKLDEIIKSLQQLSKLRLEASLTPSPTFPAVAPAPPPPPPSLHNTDSNLEPIGEHDAEEAHTT